MNSEKIERSMKNFKQNIDRAKSERDNYGMTILCTWLETEGWFEEMNQAETSTQENIKYLLTKTDENDEWITLCKYNIPLVKYILNEFLVNKEFVEKFEYAFNVFDMIEHCNTNNAEILKLNELNRKIYMLNGFDLTKEQKLELYELLKDHELAQNRLTQIIDNNLENEFDFDSLMNYLKKTERKNLINI